MLSFPVLAGIFLVFWGLTFGLAWPLAVRWMARPAERLLASGVLSLLGVFLFGWMIYVGSLPTALFWLLPLLALAGFATGRRDWAEAWRDPEVRALVAGQALVTCGCVGWLALVRSYAGGAWSGDWFGHWQRTRFFLEHGSREILFNGFDPLASRPPLANVVNGAFLSLGGPTFALYQFISTLFGSLVFLPAALLAGRWGGLRAIALLAALFLVSPLLIQNATYAWTKLPAAFFILAALYFFLRAQDAAGPRCAGVLFAVSLAAGLLTHYSAGPYAVLLALGWFALGRPRWREGSYWRTTAAVALAGTAVLAPWFGWSVAVYGIHGTFLSNTTVTDQAPTFAAQAQVVALNFRDTLVPPFLRGAEPGLLAQGNPWGEWRDGCFLAYQQNVLLAFGSAAWVALLCLGVREGRRAPAADRRFWISFVVSAAALGIVASGAREAWGLAHLCLQPLVLLGLAWLAARWASLSPAWRRALLAGATLDFVLGIALQFGCESLALDHWLAPGQSRSAMFLGYSRFAVMNLRAKVLNQWEFLGDTLPFPPGWMMAGLAGVLALALVRARRGRDPLTPPAAGLPPRSGASMQLNHE